MFPDDEAPKSVRISMVMNHDDGTHIQMTKDFSDDMAWPEIAKLFYQFLSAQGYVLDAERVGVEEW